MSFLSRFTKICLFVFGLYVLTWFVEVFTGRILFSHLIYTPIGVFVIFSLVTAEAYFNNIGLNEKNKTSGDK